MTLLLDLTPRQAIMLLETDLGLSVRDIASAVDTNRRSLWGWVAGEAAPLREARRRLAALVDLGGHLLATFSDLNLARKWLNAPNRYIGGLAPLEAIRAGRNDRAKAALEALDSGLFI